MPTARKSATFFSGQEHRDDHDRHPREGAPEDRLVGAVLGGQPTEEQGATERDELDQQDRRDQHRVAELELLRAVRRRGVDDRLDAVVVEDVGEQEGQRHRVVAQLLERGEELSEAALHRPPRPPPRAHRGRLRSRRNGMIVKPAHQTAAESSEIRTASSLSTPDGVVAEHDAQVDEEQQTAAEVAEGPAARGDVVALRLGGDVAQDRVVADQRAARPARCSSRSRTPPSCQLSSFMRNSSAAKNAPAHAKPAMCSFLRGDRSTIAPTIGQDDGAEDGGEAGQVERQRAGGQVQPQQAHRLVAGVVRVVAAARRPAGDGDHERREQHRQHGRVVGRVGPVVPVPGLLLAVGPVRAARGPRTRSVVRVMLIPSRGRAR